MKIETTENMTCINLTEEEINDGINCFVILNSRHGNLKKGCIYRLETIIDEIDELTKENDELYERLNKR